jgi:prepilin-type N-terminal cleavage/methylation domain-containing protein
MRKSTRRKGFTLPEVLVTVTIVAVLAAVMVPAVINQVSKGDAPSVAQDISGIRTAITTFAADVRHFPSKLSQLGGSSLIAADSDIVNVQYGLDNANYRGPYAPIVSGHTGPTGAIFANRLVQGNGRGICMVDSIASGGASNITPSEIAQLKTALDQNNPAIAGNSGVSGSGSVTYQLVNNTGTITVVPGSVRICVTSY